METNQERLREIIEEIALHNDTPEDGVSRFSYGKKDAEVREYLMEICRDIGLAVRVDGAGNIFARMQGTKPELPIVLSGSHIDSVKNGGRFDGLVGCIGALEAVRVMKENGYQPQNSIDVAFFAEEEGSNFQVPVMGSKLITGKLSVEDIKKTYNAEGQSAYEVIKNAGFDPDQIPHQLLKKGDIKAMIELHIEQSVLLDAEKHTIGIVSGIAGLKWIKVTLKGKTNHAGATPMHIRKDPMVAAGRIIGEIDQIASSVNNTAVATVGNLEVQPNIPNAIPGIVTFIVDVRDVDNFGIDEIIKRIHEITEKHARDNEVTFEIEGIASSTPIKIPQYLKEAMEVCAKELELDYIMMPSGAVHDSNYIAEVTDVGMIFVPSKDGRSHVRDEFTDWKDIKAGADLLLRTLMRLTS